MNNNPGNTDPEQSNPKNTGAKDNSEEEFSRIADTLDQMKEAVKEQLDQAKEQANPENIKKRFISKALYNAVVMIALIAIATYIWGPMPWLWWTGAIIFICLSVISIWIYLKAKENWENNFGN